eukprot:gene10492-19204_t
MEPVMWSTVHCPVFFTQDSPESNAKKKLTFVVLCHAETMGIARRQLVDIGVLVNRSTQDHTVRRFLIIVQTQLVSTTALVLIQRQERMHCISGFAGSSCQHDRRGCASLPCQNGGVCNETSNSTILCRCRTAYSGKFCETRIRHCSSNPCRNNGSCIEDKEDSNNGSNIYATATELVYYGKRCDLDVNECLLSPCQHGVNVNSPGAFLCDCSKTGIQGNRCQSDINECTNGLCSNGGVCVNSAGSYYCNCSGTGYHGNTVQLMSMNASKACLHNSSCLNTKDPSFVSAIIPVLRKVV